MSNNHQQDRHLFFVYADAALTAQRSLTSGNTLTIISKELAHRLYTILRLRTGEMVQLFSTTHTLTVKLLPSPRTKDTIVATIEMVKVHTPPSIELIACIGLLKKESFEEAVHHATVTGATQIQPLITEKSRTDWLNEREPERLRSMIIAAAEQSKNNHIPLLHSPRRLASTLTSTNQHLKIGFEATSAKTFLHLCNQTPKALKSITIFIGPEGGFTSAEITAMTQADVIFYSLTKTILRSQEAVCLGVGAIAAVMNS